VVGEEAELVLVGYEGKRRDAPLTHVGKGGQSERLPEEVDVRERRRRGAPQRVLEAVEPASVEDGPGQRDVPAAPELLDEPLLQGCEVV
jgi:hypothetical protein